MLRFACVLILVSGVIALELQAQIGNQWQKFKAAHGKKYSSAEEETRKAIFKKNVETILQHNLRHDLGEETSTMGVNQFSDMSQEEFIRTMTGGIRPNVVPNITLGKVFVPSRRTDLPDSIDWRDRNIVSPVKQQGRCGSCWAFSVVAAVESAWALKMGEGLDLSEQQILDCASLGKYRLSNCMGGYLDDVMRYVAENGGIVHEKCYQYYGVKGTCRFDRSCLGARVSSYVALPPYDEEAMKEAVATQGPISVSLYAGDERFKHYEGGIINPPNCLELLYHFALLVGYGTDNGQDYWIIKNSWGLEWGDKGYFKIARNANGKCAIDYQSLYPVV